MLAPAQVSAHAAAALVQELAEVEGLPPYNADKVAAVVEDATRASAAIDDGPLRRVQEVGTRHPTVLGSLAVHTILDRNVQGLALYHYERVMRLVEGLCDGVSVFPNASEAENGFAEAFRQLRRRFLLSTGLESLTLFQVPPTASMVEVMCLEDVGDVLLADGTAARMAPGSVHYVLRSDVEQHIVSGGLCVLDSGW